MPNYPVGNDQAYLITDTTQRVSPAIIMLRAVDATPIFWSQERNILETNLDAGGNPRGGMLMLQTDPPVILTGARIIVWARAAQGTFMSCEVIEQRSEVTVAPRKSGSLGGRSIPGAAPPSQGQGGTQKSPGFWNAWTTKKGAY